MPSRVLQLSPRLPLPLDDGGRIATWNLSRCLQHSGYEVDLVCHAASQDDLERHRGRLSEVFYSWSAVVKDMERQYPADLLLSLVTGTSYFARKFRNRQYAERVESLLRQNRYEVTLVDGAYMGVYLDLLRDHRDRSGRIILRAHNVEREILARLARKERFLPYRYLIGREERLFGRFETQLLDEVDEVKAITRRDAEQLQKVSNGTINVLEPFIDVQSYTPDPEIDVEPHSIVHVGNMAWMPNSNGLRWFLQEVWPRVRSRYDDAKLYLVGKNPPGWIQQIDDSRVVVTGYVEDERPYIQRANVFIVPLFEGSGIRMKILTAMAMGTISLSTSMGAEGIEWPGLQIADDAEGWLEAIDALFEAPPEPSTEAMSYLQRHYDWRRELRL